jgi:hypothetical protein
MPAWGRKEEWFLVMVDQEPLRQSAISQCKKSMTAIEKARAEQARFEHEDKPAFSRWLSATFGPQLTELRELDARLREKNALADEVEAEMMFGGRNCHEAYQAVMRHRERIAQGLPDPEEEEIPAEEDFGGGAEEKVPMDEFELSAMFDDFLIQVMGINPDRMADAEYNAMFADFKRTFGGGGEEKAEQPREFIRPARAGFAEAAPRDETRLKELYRQLVRRLHPDMRADGDATVADLWHEVQEAYARRDVDRLETLLASADVREKRFGPHTSLGQLRAVLAELRQTLNALRRSLREAREVPAWGFSKLTDRRALQRTAAKELAYDLKMRRADLAHVEDILAFWSQPPVVRRRAKSKKAGRGQAEFSF